MTPGSDPLSLKFNALLDVFQETIKDSPPAAKVKQKLLDLKEMAKNTPELNSRQMEAVIARCDNYINGDYGSTKTEENLAYGRSAQK